MALADTARLAVQLDLKGNFATNLKSTQKALSGFDKSITNTQGRAFKAGQQIGTGIKSGAVIAAGALGFLATNVGLGLRSLSELETVVTQTNAVLKSTKGAAGQTADSIRNLAQKYEGLNATIDDKVIQSAENVLLTFTAVRKQAFEPAIKAALDMSTALGTDLQGSVIQIGKALQDPVKGINALRRAGVNFSADQIKVIKALVATGDTLGAQKIILAELNKEFGGSFLAGGNTTAGKVAKFKDSIEDLQKALAQALLPTIGKVATALSKFLSDPAVISGVEDLGKSIASLFSDDNLAKGADFLKGAFETAKEAAPVVAAGAKATFGLVQAAVGLFRSLPPEIQKLAVGAFAVNKLTGGLVTNIAGGIIDTVGRSFLQRGGTPANPLFVVDVGGGIGKAIPGVAAAAGAASVALPVAVIAASIAGPIIAQQKISSDLQIQAYNDVTTKVATQINGGSSLAELKQSLIAVKVGIAQIQVDPLNVLVGGQALDELKSNASSLQQAIDVIRLAGRDTIGGLDRVAAATQTNTVATVHATDRAEAIASQKANSIRAAAEHAALNVRRVEAAENRTSIATRTVATRIDNARRAQVAAAYATSRAVKDKKTSFNITVPVTTNVSIRDIFKKVSQTTSYGRLQG